MGFTLKEVKYYSTVCHIAEFTPAQFRLDVSLGIQNVLERLSKMKGEPKADEEVILKANAAFFDMSGKSGDIYSSFVDEGLYYHGASPLYPTLIFWKDLRLTVEHNPPQARHAVYQSEAYFAIGSAWTLVVDGKINYTHSRSTLISAFGHPWSRNPRTFIGQKANGNIIIVVTNGRVKGSSGLTIDHEAKIMMDLGCVLAVNMDGGGSSEMIHKGKIVNKLQGGYERPIGTAFLVYGKKNTSNTPAEPTKKTVLDAPVNKTGTAKVVNASSLNVRYGPGTGYAKIASVARNTPVTINGTSIDGKWTRISTATLSAGWVSSSYLSVAYDSPATTVGKKTTAALRMRAGRGVGNKIICTIPKGKTVLVSDNADGWYRVQYNGRIGYCSASYLK